MANIARDVRLGSHLTLLWNRWGEHSGGHAGPSLVQLSVRILLSYMSSLGIYSKGIFGNIRG